MGGDLAGKEMVPIVDGSARFRGSDFAFKNDGELEDFERRVAAVGGYTLRTDAAFVERLKTDQDLAERTMRELIVARTEAWVKLARERLEGTGIRLLLGLGNDDFEELIPHLDTARSPTPRTARRTSATSTSPRWDGATRRPGTPTASARRTPDGEARDRDQAPTPRGRSSTSTSRRTTAGSISSPGLDQTRCRSSWSAVSRTWSPIGSTAVATAIETHQPVLSLHGHVHQARIHAHRADRRRQSWQRVRRRLAARRPHRGQAEQGQTVSVVRGIGDSMATMPKPLDSGTKSDSSSSSVPPGNPPAGRVSVDAPRRVARQPLRRDVPDHGLVPARDRPAVLPRREPLPVGLDRLRAFAADLGHLRGLVVR